MATQVVSLVVKATGLDKMSKDIKGALRSWDSFGSNLSNIFGELHRAFATVERAFGYMAKNDAQFRAIWTDISAIIKERYVKAVSQAIADSAKFEAGLNALEQALIEAAPGTEGLAGELEGLARDFLDGLKTASAWGVGLIKIFNEAVTAVGWLGDKIGMFLLAPFIELSEVLKNIPGPIGEIWKTVNLGLVALQKGPQDVATEVNAYADKAVGVLEKLGTVADSVGRAMDTTSGTIQRKTDEKVKAMYDEIALMTSIDESITAIFRKEEELSMWQARMVSEASAAYKKADDEIVASAKEKDKKLTELAKERQEEISSQASDTVRSVASGFEQVAGIIQGAVESVASGSKSAKDAAIDAMLQMVQMALRTAMSMIVNFAASAAAEAGSAVASIPYIGPALAVAAAATVFGALMAYRSKARGLAQGADIHGGIPGRDSVPAMLMDGEKVLNPREAKEYDQMMRGRSTNQPQVIINAQIPSTMGSRVEVERWAIDVLEPVLKRAWGMGHFRFMGAS